jgi:hypothetical protein
MTTGEGAVAIRVCFRSAIKNADIIIGTRDVSKARMVAQIWGERTEGEPVTRTVFKGMVQPPSTALVVIDDVPVWPPVF